MSESSPQRIADYKDFSRWKTAEPPLKKEIATILYPIFPHLSARRLELTSRFKISPPIRSVNDRQHNNYSGEILDNQYKNLEKQN